MNVRSPQIFLSLITVALAAIFLCLIPPSVAESMPSLAGEQWSGELAPAPGLEIILGGNGDGVVAEFPQLGQAVYTGAMRSAADGATEIVIPTPIGEMALRGKFAGQTFEGSWQFGKRNGPCVLRRGEAVEQPWLEAPVEFRGAGGVRLSGVVLSPRAAGKHPAFIGIHGSGAETRAGQNRFLAERLVREGAVILLFDKRGSGRSEGDWRKATLEELAGDVDEALQLVSKRAEVDANRLGLFGASQAGWVAAIVAARRPEVHFLMMRSAPLTTVAEEGNYDYLQKLKGQPPAVLDRAKHILALEAEVTRTGKGIEALAAEIALAHDEAWFKQMDFSPLPAEHPSRTTYR
nr:alpha/beta hydrolase [Gemmatimonadaceae bacterium]